MSRLENAPSLSEVARPSWSTSSATPPPAAITLDIDDTCDRVHGGQQLSLFNAIRGSSPNFAG